MRTLAAAIAVSTMLGLGAAQAARPANMTEPMVPIHQVSARTLASAEGSGADVRATTAPAHVRLADAEGAGADARSNQRLT
jgi:hypothetical protein